MENWLSKRVQNSPQKMGLKTKDNSWSFAEIGARVARQVTYLTDYRGVKPDMRVAVFGFNSVELYFQLLSLQQMRCEIVCLNPRLSEKELTYQLLDAQVELLFYAPDTASEKLTFFQKVVACYPFNVEQDLHKIAASDLPSHFNESDVTTIMYTSGTTGKPKGVCQSYANHFWSAIGSVLNLGLQAEDCWGCPVPLFHISGFSIVMRSLIYGMGMYLFENYEAQTLDQALVAQEITLLSVVPTMLQDLVEQRNLAEAAYPATLRHVLLGGAPSRYALLEEAAARNIPVIPSYGMTETASQVVAMPSHQEVLENLGSSGKPLMTVDVRILNEEGAPCPASEIGEIAVRSKSLTVGYLNQAAKYQSQLTADGYFRTGDLGYQSPSGYLYVVNRLSERFTSGGENVFPHEIEQELRKYPEIQDVVVVGKEDAKWGAVPVAFVILTDPQNPAKATLAAQFSARLRTVLASYKIPKEFIYTEAFPRNATGKIMRQTLQSECED